jgi:hypothetical protein
MTDEFEVPVPEDYSQKEMYAFFGLTAYWAQVAEYAALNLAVVLKLPEVRAVDQRLFEDVFNGLSKKTLGQLLKAARKSIEIDSKTETLLEEALELRNILTHEFFRAHAENIVSEAGRKFVMEQLCDIMRKFKKADKAIESLYLPLWEKYGVDEAFIEKELAAMKKRAEERDGAA